MSANDPARVKIAYAAIVGGIVALVALTVLAGCVLGVPQLTSLASGWPAMAPLTATSLGLCGLALAIASREAAAPSISPVRRLAVIGFAGAAAIAGATRLTEYLFGWNLGLDALGLQHLAAMHGMQLGSMSPATALGVALVGVGVTLTQERRWARTCQTLALLAFFVAWLGLARYLFGGAPLIPYGQMAIHTAITLILLPTAVLALRGDTPLMQLVADAGPAGAGARRLLPAALLVPLAAGALALTAEHDGVLSVEQSFALFALTTVLVFAGSVCMNAAQLRRSDAQRQRAVTALRESQELLKGIVESSDDAIISKTLSGVITSWNRGAERLFGYGAQSAIGQSMHLIIPPERLEEEPAILSRIAHGEPVDHFETVRVRADGTRLEVSATISPVRDATGTIIGASKIARDITERKAHQRKIQAQLEHLNLLQQITRAIAERQDIASIFQVAVRSLEDQLLIDFGCACLYTPTHSTLEISCVGLKSRELAMELALSERARIPIDENGLGRCVRGELVYEADVSESSFPFPARLARAGLRSLVVTPLSVEDTVFGVLIIARRTPQGFSSTDCEFLRQLSEHLALAAHQARLHSALQRAYEDLRQTQDAVMQQERLRALGEMASGIAHDINNALSPAALYAQSLLEGDQTLRPETREYLAVIQRAIDGVVDTIARMRMFYRPREAELAKLPLDLNALLQQVVELTRVRWSDMPQERGIVIELRSELTPRIPPVIGIESEIRDAVTNLIFNAVDAMPEGGTLTVRSSIRPSAAARHGATGAGQVSVEVCDTGIGMTEEVRRRCLEPFFTTKGERGTGLGLAMVYGMARRHSGDLEIESAPGEGTTVRLVFPATALQVPSETPAPARALKPMRILIVDDDPLLLKSLKDVLELEGHSVIAADGGQSGIDEFMSAHRRGEHFQAVITDLGMPRLDGRTVAAAIKTAAPLTPVILLTGWGQRLQTESDLPDHVDRVLGKPPRLSELHTALRDLTDG